MYILTLNQIVEKFREWSEKHKFINDFGYGDSSMIGDSRAVKYPLMWSTHSRPSTIQVSNKTQIPTHSFSFIFVDVINIQDNYKDENGFESDNSQEVLSDTQQYAQDFILFLTSYMSKFGLVIRDNDITLTQVFDNLTTDKVCGWTVDIDITAKHSNCVTPADGVGPSQPPMPTPTSVTYLTCDTLPTCQTIIDIETNLNTIEGDITKTATLGTNDILTFKNTSGATLYTVDLSSLGGGGSANDYTTAATLSGNILTFDRTDLVNAYSVDLSGLAGTGGLTCADLPTCQTIIDIENNITTLQNNQFSGNYNDLTNKPTLLSQFTNDVGYITSYTDTNDYTTSATFSNGIITYNRTDLNSAYSIDISSVNTDTNYYVNGATLSGTTLTATGNDISTGFSIDLSSINTDTDTNDYTIGATLSGNIINFDRTDLVSAYNIDLTPILFSGNYNDLTNAPTNVSAFTNDAGYITTDTNDYTTTATLDVNNVLRFDRTDLNNAYSVDLSSIASGGNYLPLTGGTLTGNLNITNGGNLDVGDLLITDILNNGVVVKGELSSRFLRVTIPTATLGVLSFRADENGVYALNDINNTNSIYGYRAMDTTSPSSTTALYNTAIGTRALLNANDYNIGANDGSRNTAIGFESLKTNNAGFRNTSIGHLTMFQNTTGESNTAIGDSALYENRTGNYNVALGRGALRDVETASNNVAIGYASANFLWFNEPVTGSIFIGERAGQGLGVLRESIDSIFIGKRAKALNEQTNNEIVIGADATGNGDNTTTIGNTSTLSTYIQGQLNIDIINNGQGNFITKNASGTLTERTPAQVVSDLNITTTDTNDYTTGATFSNGTITFDRTDLASAYSIDISGVNTDTNYYVNGATLSGNTLTATGNDISTGFNIDLTPILFSGNYNDLTNTPTLLSQFTNDVGYITTDTNDYTNAASISGNIITFNRTDLASAYNVDISPALTPLQNDITTNTNDITTLQTVEYWTVELMDKLIYTIYASEAISITVITNIVNAPTTTIKVNGVAYTLGNPIASGDKIDVEVNTASVVKLKIEK